MLNAYIKILHNSTIDLSGYLDNSVAGGITSGMSKFESIVKESMEEASIAEDVVRNHVKATGAISYYRR